MEVIFFPFVASFQIVAIAGARPVIMDVISVALALFFPVVAAFYINAFAPARPETMAIIYFALALRFTLLGSHKRTANGRPYGSVFLEHLIRLAAGEPPSPQGEGCLRIAKVQNSFLKKASV